jgi:hypothetical protein
MAISSDKGIDDGWYVLCGFGSRPHAVTRWN